MSRSPRFALSAFVAISVLPLAPQVSSGAEPEAPDTSSCVELVADPMADENPTVDEEGNAVESVEASPTQDCDTETNFEAPAEESVEQPGGESSGDATTIGDEPETDEQTGDEQTGDEPESDETARDEPAGNEPAGDVPAGNDPVGDQPDEVVPVEETDQESTDLLDTNVGTDEVDETATVPVEETRDESADLLDMNDGAEVHEADASEAMDDPIEELIDDSLDVADESVAPSPGLRAASYDGVYAQGVPVWVAMGATRQLESGGDYAAQAWGSTASGAYQVIDSTWNRYGGYARAIDAPPEVQDQFAYESMVMILKRFGNEVAAIPVAWYFPAALSQPALMDVVPALYAGNVLTPREYQGRWMQVFNQLLDAGSPVYLPSDTDPLIPAIAFPVLGPTSFWDDWHAPRDGGDRYHEGLDFMGQAGQPLRAAFDGVVTRLRPTDSGRAGIGITITRDDGVRANYFHLDAELTWHPALEVGSRVKAGQIVGFMGATGNAGVPHLHFELRTPDGEPIAPYAAALEAVQREQCSVGIGPWATAFLSPTQYAAALAEAIEAAGPGSVSTPVYSEIAGPELGDGTWWTVGSDGSVTATGRGALIAPDQGACGRVPVDVFGTDAAGVGVDELPVDWWGDDLDDEALAALIEAVAVERSEEFDDPAEPVVDPTIDGTASVRSNHLRPT